MYVLLVALTWTVHVAALQWRESIFGGAGWLTEVRYETWPERGGLLLLLAIFCAAAVGTWLLVWRWASRPWRRLRGRVVGWAGAAWVALLVVDVAVRQELDAVLGGAVDLLSFAEGVGGAAAAVRNLWRWYAPELVLSGLGVVGVALASAAVLRLLRNPRLRWGVVDAIAARHVGWATVLSVAMVMTFLTAFSHVWPATRELLVDETLVGWPFGVMVAQATDFDGDGYSPFDNPPDRAPFDGALHPYAVDTPGDGIDQDQLGGDLDPGTLPLADRALLEGMHAFAPVRFQRRPHVVLVVLESTRHDALDSEVAGQAVMPRLRRAVAEGALLPERFYATRGFTNTSLGNLFWGGYFRDETTLLDDFRGNGYQLVAFSGYDLREEGVELSAGLRAEEVRFDPRSDPAVDPRRGTSPARRVVVAIERFLGSDEPHTRPFFMFVHLQDPHFPYDQDNPLVLAEQRLARRDLVPTRADALRRTYLDQVYHLDVAAGRILDALRSAGIAEQTTVLFVSDHGEALFDEGRHLGHGLRFDDVMTRCLAVFVNPPGDVPATMSHVDVRRWLRQQLAQPPPSQPPRVVQVPEHPVFQFLGSPRSPSSIARYTQRTGRVVYDFEANALRDERSGEVRAGLLAADAEPGNHDALAQAGRALIDGWAYLQFLSAGHSAWTTP